MKGIQTVRHIKFTTAYERTISFDEKNFKKKYEERVGNNPAYMKEINGELKHLAVCPRCNNPVVILGIYKKIDSSPHARHAKNVNISGVADYNEYKYLRCPYHKKQAGFVKEYVPETEEPARRELYRLAKENFDRAIYLLEKTTGLRFTMEMSEKIAQNYAAVRAYNYIDANNYNIPWYLLYSHNGFNLYHCLIKKDSTLYRHLKKAGAVLVKSRLDGYAYVEKDKTGRCDHVLTATDFTFSVDKAENLNERLEFSILMPDQDVDNALLFKAIDRFSIKVDSYYFGNLITYDDWKPDQRLLDIAKKYMGC